MMKRNWKQILKTIPLIFCGPILNNFNRKSPVIILSPSKTGSTSVYSSLKNIENKSVFKSHFLSKKSFSKKYKIFFSKENAKKEITPHVIINTLLILKLKTYRKKIYLIVTIRNPIDQRISAIFQSWENHNLALFDKVESPDYMKTIKFIGNNIKNNNPSNYLENWIKNEIEVPYDIDIFNRPFSQEMGYEIFESENISLLLLKMETMENIFQNAIQDFLKTKIKYPLNKENIGVNKIYKESYTLIKNNLKIDKKEIDSIINSRFFNHFYKNDANKMYEKWCNNL